MHCRPGPLHHGAPMIMGGRSWGRTQLATARLGQRQFAWARVPPGQRLCVDFRAMVVAHGKEKVYGSIP
jgi:hypothetical protein